MCVALQRVSQPRMLYIMIHIYSFSLRTARSGNSGAACTLQGPSSCFLGTPRLAPPSVSILPLFWLLRRCGYLLSLSKQLILYVFQPHSPQGSLGLIIREGRETLGSAHLGSHLSAELVTMCPSVPEMLKPQHLASLVTVVNREYVIWDSL